MASRSAPRGVRAGCMVVRRRRLFGGPRRRACRPSTTCRSMRIRLLVPSNRSAVRAAISPQRMPRHPRSTPSALPGGARSRAGLGPGVAPSQGSARRLRFPGSALGSWELRRAAFRPWLQPSPRPLRGSGQSCPFDGRLQTSGSASNQPGRTGGRQERRGQTEGDPCDAGREGAALYPYLFSLSPRASRENPQD
jgi:hypothetical protein